MRCGFVGWAATIWGWGGGRRGHSGGRKGQVQITGFGRTLTWDLQICRDPGKDFLLKLKVIRLYLIPKTLSTTKLQILQKTCATKNCCLQYAAQAYLLGHDDTSYHWQNIHTAWESMKSQIRAWILWVKVNHFDTLNHDHFTGVRRL